MPARDRPNGVIEGVGSFGADLASLGILQARLAAADLREALLRAAPTLGGLVMLGLVAVAGMAVLLAGLALWLADVLAARPGLVMMVVALVALVLSGVIAALLARTLSSSFSTFRRSQEELDRNLAWIKTTLVHSGR